MNWLSPINPTYSVSENILYQWLYYEQCFETSNLKKIMPFKQHYTNFSVTRSSEIVLHVIAID